MTVRADAMIYAEFVGGPLDGERAFLRIDVMRGHNEWHVEGDYSYVRYVANGDVMAFTKERQTGNGWSVFGDMGPRESWQNEKPAEPPVTILHYAGRKDAHTFTSRTIVWGSQE